MRDIRIIEPKFDIKAVPVADIYVLSANKGRLYQIATKVVKLLYKWGVMSQHTVQRSTLNYNGVHFNILDIEKAICEHQRIVY